MFVVHEAPVWRDRSNFIINADLPPNESSKEYEQLWARRLSEDEFEICCIPFFLYDVALGDVVRTVPRDRWKFILDAVTRPSGRYVFRVWLGQFSGSRLELTGALQGFGALLEWSSKNMFAIDTAGEADAQAVSNFLLERQSTQQLLYETGRTK